MKTTLIGGVFLWFLVSTAVAQDVSWSLSGQVIDASDTSGVAGATVMMINIKDSTRSRFVATENNGTFTINNLEQAFYRLQISSVGYQPYRRIFRLTLAETDLGVIRLEPDVKVLDEISVEGEVVPVEQLGDTTQYNADAFKTNPDANARDLVSKMPGIVVDSDGVTANGKA